MKEFQCQKNKRYTRPIRGFHDSHTVFQAKTPKRPAAKHVGFADDVIVSEQDSDKKDPKPASDFLPENKPKPILKSESSFEQPLQGNKLFICTVLYRRSWIHRLYAISISFRKFYTGVWSIST